MLHYVLFVALIQKNANVHNEYGKRLKSHLGTIRKEVLQSDLPDYTE
jgi:hypothetical protein